MHVKTRYLVLPGLFCLCLIPHWAGAEMPWKTTRWQVACTDELQQRADQSWSEWEEMIEEILEREVPAGEPGRRKAMDEMLRDGFERFSNQARMLCRPDSELMAVTAGQLERASEWLRNLGFSGPDVAMADEDIESQLFPSSLMDCLTNYCAAFEYLKRAHGVYRLGGFLRLDLFSMNALFPVREFDVVGSAINPSNVLTTYTPVHELFHAVQSGSSGLSEATMFTCENDWLIEGTARYSQVVAARKWGSLVDPSPVERYYDDSLHVPPLDCAGDWSGAKSWRLHAWKYGSWGFWQYLGRRTGTRDDFEYLATVLRQDLSPFNGLDGTHKALENWHPQGLYAFYPEFARDYLNEARYFSEEGFVRLHLPWPEEPKKQSIPDIVLPVATNAFDVRIDVPEGRSAVLRVRIPDEDEDLHLVVDNQLLSRNDRKDQRNVYEIVLTGQTEPFRRLVRVANIAPNPVTSATTAYDLEFELIPVEPCEADNMMAAVNSEEFAGTSILSAYDPDEGVEVLPGDGSFTIRGLVHDGGHACIHPLSALDMTGSFFAGHADQDTIEKTMRARAEAMQERLQGMDLDRLRSAGSGQEGLSPGQMAELMELAGKFGDMTDVLAPPDDQSADVVIHVYSPHEWIHRQGVLPPPRVTRHAGLGGWKQNAAGTLVMQLPGIAVADLEAGKTFRARAYSPESNETDRPQIVPTLAGFHSRWQGGFHPVPYPPPQNAAQARRQEQLKADCRQRRLMAEQIAEQMDGASGVLDEILSRGDCRHKGMAFEGRTQVLTGSLAGEVHVEQVSAAGVTGRFSLAGTGMRETTIYTLEYDERTGVVAGDRKEIDRQQGPISMEGRFFAPVGVPGVPRVAGGYRTVSMPGRGND